MPNTLNIFAKKLLCIVISISLVFGFSFPQAFAYGQEEGTTNVQNESAADAEQVYVSVPLDYSGNSNEDGQSSSGDEGTEQPEVPLLPPDPDPVPDPTPVEPAGPLTFKFNITGTPVIQEIQHVSTGLRVCWTPVKGVDGYLVLRRVEGAGLSVDSTYEAGLSNNSITLDEKWFKKTNLSKTGWACYATVTSPNTVSWVDKKALFSQLYEYTVIAYKTNKATSNASAGLPYIPSYAVGRDLSRPSSVEVGYKMKNPTLKTVSKNSRTLTVKWTPVAGADGYTVQCSKNSAFSGKVSKTVKGGNSSSIKITGLTKSASYCVRIRAYGNVFSGTSYSTWTTSSFTNKTKRASMSRLLYKYKVKKKVKVTTSSKSKVKGVSTSNLSSTKKVTTKVKYVTKSTPFELRVRAGQKMGRYDTMQGGCSDGTYMYLCLLSKVKKRCKIVKVRISTRRVVKISGPLKLNHGNGLAYNSKTKRIIVAHGEGNRRALTEINKTTLKKVKTHTVTAPTSLKGATPSQLRAYKGFGSIAYSSTQGVYVGLLYGSHNVVLMDANFKMIQYITLSKKNGQIYQTIEAVGDNILIGESFGSTYAKRYNILSTYNWDGQYVTTTRLQQSFELESVFAAGTRIYAGFYRSYVKNRKFMKDNYIYRVNTF